jgi:hypothetical protein
MGVLTSYVEVPNLSGRLLIVVFRHAADDTLLVGRRTLDVYILKDERVAGWQSGDFERGFSLWSAHLAREVAVAVIVIVVVVVRGEREVWNEE